MTTNLLRFRTIVHAVSVVTKSRSAASSAFVGTAGSGGAITAIASTSMADGSMHVDVVANGTIYDDLRNADGTWQNGGFIPPAQPASAPSGIGDAEF